MLPQSGLTELDEALSDHKTDKRCVAFEIIGWRLDADGLEKQAGTIAEKFGCHKMVDSEFSEYAYVIHDLNHRMDSRATGGYFDMLSGSSFLDAGAGGTAIT